MANGVRYGLAASVFSENVGRALKVAGRLDFGTVWVNEHLFPLTSEMARRVQGVGLRQGHVDLFDGGVHPRQARRGQARAVTTVAAARDRTHQPELEQDALARRRERESPA